MEKKWLASPNFNIPKTPYCSLIYNPAPRSNQVRRDWFYKTFPNFLHANEIPYTLIERNSFCTRIIVPFKHLIALGDNFSEYTESTTLHEIFKEYDQFNIIKTYTAN